jgi:DNA-binding NtrC family response regulator
MLLLAMKTGVAPGASWVISEAPLVLGRDMLCDITIEDPLVSRRHCEVVLEDGRAVLRDLGSSNATFLNGRPVREEAIETGDEIALGGAILFVTAVRENRLLPMEEGREYEATRSLKIGEPTWLDDNEETLFAQGRPRTAEDLAELFNLGRALSRANTVADIAALLMERVAERFAPDCHWLLLVEGAEQPLSIYPPENGADFKQQLQARQEIIYRAIRAPRGILLPEQWNREGEVGIRTILVAPVALSGEAVGALVALTETPRRMYDQHDLEFLLAMAHTAAPYLKAVERLEELEQENRRLVEGGPHAGPVIGVSRAIAHARNMARNCARSGLNVLITGETGTGKELIAHMIHDLSARHEKPLVVVNCAAIPDDLFESEVFGHEKGAYTGAHAARTGLFEQSDGGTLFLDEVGDLSPHNQARLLRAIETGTFRRLGGNTDIQVQVRIVAATNCNLREAVKAGSFRRDLYHRLNTFEIQAPPLRERRSDIPVLAEHFLKQARLRTHGPDAVHFRVEGFSPEALRALQNRPWPGNVRELRNTIERALVVARHKLIQPGDFDPGSEAEEENTGFPPLEEMEKRHIAEAIRVCNGNIREAADLLQIGRSTLYRKLDRYGIAH